MNHFEPGIRNTVRALIRQQGHLLLLKKEGPPLGLRYALPGGAQDLGETLERALQRECLEEINTPVSILRLLHIGDYFKSRQSDPPTIRHQLELLFECTVPEDYQPANGPHPDKQQIGVVWMPISRLNTLPLQPAGIGRVLQQAGSGALPAYLGGL